MIDSGTRISYSMKGRWRMLTRSFPLFYLLGLLVIGYLGGLCLYSKMPFDQVERVIHWIDPRLLNENIPSGFDSILPQLVTILLFLLFATHLILKYAILLIGTMRAVFWGICSGFLIAQETEFWAYALWWFPFQLIYCSLLLLIGFLLVPPPSYNQSKQARSFKGIGMLSLIYIVLIGLELFVLPYIHGL